MPFFKDTFNLIKGVFRQPQRSNTDQENRTASTFARLGPLTTKIVHNNGVEVKDASWLEGSDMSRKRKALDNVDGNVRKRAKGLTKSADATYEDTTTVSRESGTATRQQDVLAKKHEVDRHLMPPPTTTVNQEPLLKGRRSSKHRHSMDSIDSFSEIRSQRSRYATADDEYDMEAARRLAAATELPPNSGTWDTAEKELFFHLSYRGFEPLLSRAWMRDFPTLPLSLFAVEEDQTPLIEVHQSTEFRAIRILRELIETGKSVRDRALMSGAGSESRTEPVIEKAVKRYMKWAMKDMAISTKLCNPVHAVVSMKPGQSTQDTIRDLTIKMHNLSLRHRQACDILTSIEGEEGREQPPTPPHSNDETRVDEASNDSGQNLPIIYGLMICSSLLAVFTLNSHTAPPSFVVRAQDQAQKSKRADNSENVARGDQNDGRDNFNLENEENEDSGLRFIASFDFSDSAADVWNAFVIAIVTMMVRKTLAEIYEIPTGAEMTQEYEDSVLDSSLLEADEIVAGSGYVARYGGSARNYRNQTTDDYDPDL